MTPARAGIAIPIACGGRLRATPTARRLARVGGIDLMDVPGSGRRGRVEASDVEAALDDAGLEHVRTAHGIAYSDVGPKTGVPYLLFHGFAGDHTTFALLSNGLKKAGCRVVACDLPGHGRTGAEVATVADLSAGLAEFVQLVIGCKPFHLVAHSLGAVTALALAGVVDLASLTLIAPMGLAALGNVDFLTAMAAPESARALKRLLGTLTEIATGLSDTAIDAIYSEQARGRLVALAAHLGDRQASILPVLAKVARDMPVRLLIGDKDRIVDTAGLGKLSPEIALHRFADTGHMPHWESPGSVVNILLAARCHRWQP